MAASASAVPNAGGERMERTERTGDVGRGGGLVGRAVPSALRPERAQSRARAAPSRARTARESACRPERAPSRERAPSQARAVLSAHTILSAERTPS
jgi:hypothetical protein